MFCYLMVFLFIIHSPFSLGAMVGFCFSLVFLSTHLIGYIGIKVYGALCIAIPYPILRAASKMY